MTANLLKVNQSNRSGIQPIRRQVYRVCKANATCRTVAHKHTVPSKAVQLPGQELATAESALKRISTSCKNIISPVTGKTCSTEETWSNYTVRFQLPTFTMRLSPLQIIKVERDWSERYSKLRRTTNWSLVRLRPDWIERYSKRKKVLVKDWHNTSQLCHSPEIRCWCCASEKKRRRCPEQQANSSHVSCCMFLFRLFDW